jgi:hypothetical protein
VNASEAARQQERTPRQGRDAETGRCWFRDESLAAEKTGPEQLAAVIVRPRDLKLAAPLFRCTATRHQGIVTKPRETKTKSATTWHHDSEGDETRPMAQDPTPNLDGSRSTTSPISSRGTP